MPLAPVTVEHMVFRRRMYSCSQLCSDQWTGLCGLILALCTVMQSCHDGCTCTGTEDHDRGLWERQGDFG